jgi:hypothetical protein
MPTGPKGQKRPADVIGNAVHVMTIATGEVTESPAANKDKAAVELGRKGGLARAANLSKAARVRIAKQGGIARAKRRKARKRRASHSA